MFKLAEMNETAVIRKEKGEYCVRSPNNKSWNGGCFDSKGQAERRLHEVEYFKKQANTVLDRHLAQRVAGRSVLAKGVQLLPEYNKTLQALVAGDPQPAIDFINKVLGVIFGDQDTAPRAFGESSGLQMPSWFHAMGTAKKNAIIFLFRRGYIVRQDLKDVRPGIEPIFLQRQVRDYEEWGKKLRTLEIASGTGSEETLIKRDGFVIIPVPGVGKKQTEEALEALDEAASKLRAKFPQVLYGNVYFTTHLSAKAAAHYVLGKDEIALSVNARKRFSDVYTLVHEFGHRFDNMFFKNKELRTLFWSLSTRKEYETINFDQKLRREVAEEMLAIVKARKAGTPMPIASSEAMLWATTLYTPGGNVKTLNTEYLAGKLKDNDYLTKAMGHQDFKIPTDKLLHGPLHVTPYGGTKPTENFAEAFAHYVFGMDMPRELYEIIDKL